MYKYVIERNGDREKGVLEAYSMQEARDKLREKRGVRIISVKPYKQRKFDSKKVKIQDVIRVIHQLKIGAEVGLLVTHSLQQLIDDERNPHVRTMLSDMYAECSQGRPISYSMEKYKKQFSSYIVAIVREGESVGRLADSLGKAEEYLSSKVELKKEVVNALTYPTLLIVMTVGVMIYMNVKIIPVFASFFENFNSDLPPLTIAMMNFSKFTAKFGWVIALIIGIGVMLFIARWQKHKSRVKIEQRLMNMPVIGKILRNLYMYRFCDTMSTLIGSGVTPVESLRISSDVVGSVLYKDKLIGVLEMVAQGRDMSEAMVEVGGFTHIVTNMISTATETGTMVSSLSHLAKMFKAEYTEGLKKATKMIEPIVTIFIGAVIGLVVIAYMTPMYSMYEVVA